MRLIGCREIFPDDIEECLTVYKDMPPLSPFLCAIIPNLSDTNSVFRLVAKAFPLDSKWSHLKRIVKRGTTSTVLLYPLQSPPVAIDSGLLEAFNVTYEEVNVPRIAPLTRVQRLEWSKSTWPTQANSLPSKDVYCHYNNLSRFPPLQQQRIAKWLTYVTRLLPECSTSSPLPSSSGQSTINHQLIY